MATVTEIATSLTPKGVEQLTAEDPSGVANLLELTLLPLGGDENLLTTSQKNYAVYKLAYNITLAAIDIVRNKIKKGKAGPTEVEFRKEIEYLEALAKRLAKRGGFDDTEDSEGHVPFLIEGIEC